MDDQQITELFFERSDQAIKELSVKYGRSLKNISFNILGSEQDAEECVNDTYLAAWNTIPPQNPDSLYAYVCRLVRNNSLTRYTRNTAKKRNSSYDVALEELEYCIPGSAGLEDELEQKETAECINIFLASLDRDSRIMFVRRYCFSDTIGEIAGLFGTSEHYISVRLHRLRQKLKKNLAEKGVST